MKTTDVEPQKPTYWQVIFLQSKVNGAPYNGESLPPRSWDWPKNTYLQSRLRTASHAQSNARAANGRAGHAHFLN